VARPPYHRDVSFALTHACRVDARGAAQESKPPKSKPTSARGEEGEGPAGAGAPSKKQRDPHKPRFGGGDGGEAAPEAAAEPEVNKNKRYRRPKPWDHEGIEHWKVEVRCACW
jgi:hypothetical protein